MLWKPRRNKMISTFQIKNFFDVLHKYVRNVNAILIGYENWFEHNENLSIFTPLERAATLLGYRHFDRKKQMYK